LCNHFADLSNANRRETAKVATKPDNRSGWVGGARPPLGAIFRARAENSGRTEKGQVRLAFERAGAGAGVLPNPGFSPG